jgi:two-component system NtrC family sensor kinase
MRLRRAEQLSAMGTLAAGLAHELRNPANGLVNAIAPLRARLPAGLVQPESATGQLLEVIAECSSQVAFLSSQLLGFQSGGTLEMRTVDMSGVIERALVLAGPQLDGVVVKQDLDGVGAVRCAPQLLAHVVANLIQNAAQAAGRGGWVEVTTRIVKSTITVEIADSGPGVPPELRERVFEPFFTTKPGVGTGIGLPMAREIVQRHGGVLEIRERGGRVIFAVDIPAPQSV